LISSVVLPRGFQTALYGYGTRLITSCKQVLHVLHGDKISPCLLLHIAAASVDQLQPLGQIAHITQAWLVLNMINSTLGMLIVISPCKTNPSFTTPVAAAHWV
jgi:hypothetical protein